MTFVDTPVHCSLFIVTFTIVVVTVVVCVGCLCNTITTTTTMNETLYNTGQHGLYSDCLYPETDPVLLTDRLMKGL